MSKKSTTKLFPSTEYRYLKTVDPDVLQREYSRLRKVAMKRVERLEKYKDLLDVPDSYLKTFEQSSKIAPKDMWKAVQEVQSFLENPKTTIAERKRITRERREYFKDEYGLNFKNLQEYKTFFKYLEYLKAVNGENFDYAFDEMQEAYKKANQRTRQNARSLRRYMNKHKDEFTHEKPSGEFL